MSKKQIMILVAVMLIIIIACLTPILVNKINVYREELKIKNAIINVELAEDLTAEYREEKKVSDYITSINGTISDDYTIDTDYVGKKKINFKFVNEENIEVPYSYEIEIQDVTAPIVWLGKSYTVNVGFDGDLTEKIMCIDDTDDNPQKKIEGEYDFNTAGNYNLKYVATDKSGNQKIWDFTLIVKELAKTTTPNTVTPTKTLFSDALANYKQENTKVGIDVSEWQGVIDFEKVKNAGVEFAIIRIGSKKGTNGEYFIDSKFKDNIEGFTKVGIPVGVYFYSYSSSSKESLKDAEWVIKNLKGYKLDLPVAYDWENWSSFNKYHLSKKSLTDNATTFLDKIKSAGYDGMNYGSASYLGSVWFDTGYPTWLAHYTSKTSYSGSYQFWQFCANGKVDGINADVDLNVMYEKGANNE